MALRRSPKPGLRTAPVRRPPRHQDGCILEDGALPLGIGDETGREHAVLEAHAFDHAQLALQSRAVLDRDRTFAAHLVDRAGEQLADRAVVVGRDRSHHHARVHHLRRAVLALQDHGAAARAEGDHHRFGHQGHASADGTAISARRALRAGS
jgi:hypothetical protein